MTGFKLGAYGSYKKIYVPELIHATLIKRLKEAGYWDEERRTVV